MSLMIKRECTQTLQTRQELLYDHSSERSSCGVGFITRKDGAQTHDVILKGHEALCAVPHRGGMSSEGVGDGAGICIDLSDSFFSRLTSQKLTNGQYGVGNYFLPTNPDSRTFAIETVENLLCDSGLKVIFRRELPVDAQAIEQRGWHLQLPIFQWIFTLAHCKADSDFDSVIYNTLVKIESHAYQDKSLEGLYPLSMSSQTQVLKGRLNSWELVPYFLDLSEPDHCVHTLFFHTRFSTNTDPHPSMAQPFRQMAHNGELNTDKKNRLSEIAEAKARKRHIDRPKGQSDSSRFDQTLGYRIHEGKVDLVSAVVSMMPPAWENDNCLSPSVRDMFEYFSLYEEKNDGPAAVIFGDGRIIGARLDRLGLRPLRSVETDEYLAVMSEAGQVQFPQEQIISLGRIEAGGMMYYDHKEKRIYRTADALEKLSKQRDYRLALNEAQAHISVLPRPSNKQCLEKGKYRGELNNAARYVAYSHNQDSFKFLLDPMLSFGTEKVSAMGYGTAINALNDQEGGVAKYFSQRFAQVTNPPLDSIREADGMTLRVALGEKPLLGPTGSKQLIVDSPILDLKAIETIRLQRVTPHKVFDALFAVNTQSDFKNERSIVSELDHIAQRVVNFARESGGIAILSDRKISRHMAALPMTLLVAAVNQKLIEEGLRLKVSIIVESGQIKSSHHIACVLGFGASAVYALAVQMRAEETSPSSPDSAYANFAKAAEKALMKTMGKVGLCTVESYSGGEFFEPNFLDTSDPVLKFYFPNMRAPVGGVHFDRIARSALDWHQRALSVSNMDDLPVLGLFKERTDGAGHSYGTRAVREFVNLTEEGLGFEKKTEESESATPLRLLTLNKMTEALGITDEGYVNTSFDYLAQKDIDDFEITPGYRSFAESMATERLRRPAALRDVLAFPADVSLLHTAADFQQEMMRFNRAGNRNFFIRGLKVVQVKECEFLLNFCGTSEWNRDRLEALGTSFVDRFGNAVLRKHVSKLGLHLVVSGQALDYVSRVEAAPQSIPIEMVQSASEITPRLASGAMSHGALVAPAHEAVAHGINMVGGMSNCGEGGEHISRYGTIRSSRIKQFASGRFGVWAGYLADPNLEEIEIKIGQGAKPGEGGQLPAAKVTVEIAAARGGTPGVELVSPPPHHDTYSIEDLGQLIHDAKAARVRVIVKLVSSEGIGTIAVGVAKAGADVINIAGSTGGTGAASVTSLKYTGRAAELGIAEVHQALCINNIRQKVSLRCSGAMQTGSDVVKASLLGADSFEFGTTALMMLKCVMAKNCNIKCPAGLTTNEEAFDGDARALAQYLLNISHEVREILARLGFRSLDEARGRADLLHLLDHPSSVGQLNTRAMLVNISETEVSNPTYLECNYDLDETLFEEALEALSSSGRGSYTSQIFDLTNRQKSVGGRLSADIERWLNYEQGGKTTPHALEDDRRRRFLPPNSISIQTCGSAGQSYGVFCNDGMRLHHFGTCNDGVGKGACGGEIIIQWSQNATSEDLQENVLIGNFALFGATGGRLFVRGQAGDRFAVRNSGATAVVEGVGDFFCEYMTNGTVLNLGKFSKGFGNGMSGGFAFQYDPSGALSDSVSHDSVLFGSIMQDDSMGEVFRLTVETLLQQHVDATSSSLASHLLKNWKKESENFYWIMPKALLQYQDADKILAVKTRKELVDEVSKALARAQILRLKKAWKESSNVLGGISPATGESDSKKMFQLVNSWTVLDIAQQITGQRKLSANKTELERITRNLIMTEDFELQTRLTKHAKAALSGYSDLQLASLVAYKRMTDFKEALTRRTVRSMDSFSTYGWILCQDAKNIERLGAVPCFEELFAGEVVPERVMALGAT